MDYNEIMKVLIIDDRPENLLVVESVIDNLEIEIFKATSGNDALSLMLDHDFGLVILDVQMPKMDGFEVADLMKGMEKTRDIPIIFLTALSKEESSIYRGYKVGAVDYLFKPIQPIVLISKVKVFISLFQQKVELQRQAAILEDRIQELLELKKEKKQLENLSQMDGLTKIPNRRTLDHFMKKQWKNAQNGSLLFSFLMIDIDFFKNYNDNYGHVQGDRCLRQVAQVISNTLNPYHDCLVGRFGGEEFSVILPNRNEEEAIKIAESIQKNIQSVNILHEYSPFKRITVCIGTASKVVKESDSLDEFITNTDSALYDAKRNGRNRIETYHEFLANV